MRRDDVRRVIEGLRFEVSAGRRGVREWRRPVGMALYGDVTYDSRVRKEARTLAQAGTT